MSELIQQDLITGVRFSGAFIMFAFACILAIIYQGRIQSRTYNVSRWLLVAGTLVLAIHNGIQFLGHYREESACTAWVINIVCYAFTASMFGLAEINLLRSGHHIRRIVIFNIASFATILILLAVGYLTDTLINDADPLHTVTCGMAIIYTFLLVRMNAWVMSEMRMTDLYMSLEADNELSEKHTVLRYTALSMQLIMIISVVTPWIGISSSLLANGLMGMVVFIAFIWYMVAFIMYGHDMPEVIEMENELFTAAAQADDATAHTVVKPMPVEQPQDYVEQRVEEWVNRKRYTDPNLTIHTALSEMGITAAALSFYLQNRLNISHYRKWIPALRIEEAKRLMLEHPDYTFEAIAEGCGLSNNSALARAFRTQTGYSPSQWIAHYKAGKINE